MSYAVVDRPFEADNRPAVARVQPRNPVPWSGLTTGYTPALARRCMR
jgi:hypothetical protein